jgi:hypothetical protein
MNSILDLSLLLIARHGGEDLSELPDLYATTPPRRTARGREADSLVIYLSLVGNLPLTTVEHTRLLESQAQKFYKTTGSLTAALRSVAETLNLNLLDRNLRSTGVGKQGIGQLLLLALRGDTLYLAQCGAVHAYQVRANGTQPLYDLQTSGRGLGLSQSTPVRFLQVKLAVGDYLVLSTIPAPAWSEASLQHPAQGGIEALRHQLAAEAGQEFNAVIVQPGTGTGKLKVLKYKPGTMATPSPAVVNPTTQLVSDPTPTPVEAQAPGVSQDATLIQANLEPAPTFSPDHTLEDKPGDIAPEASLVPLPEDRGSVLPASHSSEIPTPAEELPPQVDKPAEPPPTVLTPTQITAAAASTAAQPAAPHAQPAQAAPISPQVSPGPVPLSSQRARPIAAPAGSGQPATVTSKPPQKTVTTQPSRGSKQLASLRVTLASGSASILRFLRNAFTTAGKALLRLLKNLLPDADVFHLPASTMVFIAIAIPLVLAVLGGMVFLQRGQAEQHQVYYQQAVEKADYAASLTNPLEQRLALQTALGVLDKAEEYSVTSQSQALRAQLTSSLDALDAVKRVDYKQAIVNGLDANVRVSRIVAAAADLYLLDGNTGSVLHAVMTSRGYELDPTFMCGPTQGPIDVGPLVDIVELPPGGIENASLLGMDTNGNLLYCVVGAQPYSNTLAPPNAGLGSPVGLSLDRSDLYVLDPSVNAVWIYRNLEVGQPPRYFFGDDVPPMQDVVDMEVYNDDLYMLHADGHTTKCTYSGMVESPTRCEDPYPYSDNRPGRTHGPVIEDAVFSQIDYITFPERSIFYLDPQHQAIYYFSVLLTLQYQYQPKAKLAQGDATAFAISANRVAFLAVGNNVYYAAMP